MKVGHNNTKKVISFLKSDPCTIKKILKVLTDEYYLRRTSVPLRKGSAEHIYEILPKAEEFLSKNPKYATVSMIGKIVGVDRTYVGHALYLMEKAPEDILDKLNRGKLTISQAYTILTGIKHKVYSRTGYLNAILECPHCKQTSPKKDFRLI